MYKNEHMYNVFSEEDDFKMVTGVNVAPCSSWLLHTGQYKYWKSSIGQPVTTTFPFTLKPLSMDHTDGDNHSYARTKCCGHSSHLLRPILGETLTFPCSSSKEIL